MSMVMKFQKVELQENETYPAKIKKLEIDRARERVRIWVSLRRYNHVSFFKSVPYQLDTTSELFKILDGLGVISMDRVNVKKLEQMDVVVSMSQGKGLYPRWYVSKISLPMGEEEEDEADDLDDDEYDDDYYEDDEYDDDEYYR